jgi:hypothetical protein
VSPKISELLKELKEIDPETYTRFYKTLNRLGGSQTENSTIEEILKDELQKSVISRKNGTARKYQITPMNGSDKYLARISRIIGEYPNKKKEHYTGHGDSPAEALLSAYLMLLRGDTSDQD